jgi:hypothetical protein
MVAGGRVLVEVFDGAWSKRFSHFVENTRTELLVVSPFLGTFGSDLVLRNLRSRVKLRLLTAVTLRHILDRASDYEALATLAKRGETRNLERLHAKVYLSDQSRAIVTSANLTQPGLTSNHELGIELSQDPERSRVITEVEALWAQGNPIRGLPPARSVLSAASTLRDSFANTSVFEKPFIEGSILGQVQTALTPGVRPVSPLKPLRPSILQRVSSQFKSQPDVAIKEIELESEKERARTLRAVIRAQLSAMLQRGVALQVERIYDLAKQAHPHLCNDGFLCTHRGITRNQAEWKHQVRWALLDLRHQGVVERTPQGHWYLV